MTETPNSAEKRLPDPDPIPVETLAADEGVSVVNETPAQDEKPLHHESLEEPLAKAAEVPPVRSPEASPHPMPTAEMSRPSSGFLPMLAGGVLAAAIGAGAAWYLLPRLTPPAPVQDISAFSGRINQQANEIAQLRTRLDDLPPPAAPVTLEPLESGIAEVRNNLIGTQSTVSALAERLGALETRAAEAPAGTGVAAGPEVSGLISELQNQIAEQTRRAEELSTSLTQLSGTMESRIAGEAQNASRAAADAIGARIALAVEAGLPYQIMLDQARESGLVVPEALAAHAGGVPSLAVLRDEFPPAARAALEQSNMALAGSGMGERMTAFVRNQLGIRSLSPQEGTAPDAVLSRMEAAVSAGRIQDALTEAQQLPAPGQQAMADWLAGAKARVEALSAAQVLAPASGN